MSYSKQDLEKMGRAAARVYRERNIDMNSSIAKLAVEKELNRHQIQRVIEFANHDCFETERRRRVSQGKEAGVTSKGDHYIVFDMAEPKKVLSKMSGRLEKKASYENPFDVPMTKDYSRETPRDVKLNTSLPLPPSIKTAASRQEARAKSEELWGEQKVDPLVAKIARAQEAAEKVKEKQLQAEVARLESEDKIAAVVRHLVLDQGMKYDDVLYAINVERAHGAKEATRKDIIGVLAKVSTQLSRAGVIRLASEVNPEEFIAKKFDMGAMGPMRIVNGNNPIFGEIDLFLKNVEQERHYGAALHVYNDKIRYAKRVLRGEVPRTDTSNTVRADTDKTAGFLSDVAVPVTKGLANAGGTVLDAFGGMANNIYAGHRERAAFQQDMNHPLMSGRAPAEIAPYHKLLSKWMKDKFIDMPPDIRAKLLLQMYHVGGAPDEQGGIDIATLKALQDVGGTNPRYRKDEVRKEKGMLERMVA